MHFQGISSEHDAMKLGEPCSDEWADTEIHRKPKISCQVVLKENVFARYHFVFAD